MDEKVLKRSVMAGIGLAFVFAVVNGLWTYIGDNETLEEWSNRQTQRVIA